MKAIVPSEQEVQTLKHLRFAKKISSLVDFGCQMHSSGISMRRTRYLHVELYCRLSISCMYPQKQNVHGYFFVHFCYW